MRESSNVKTILLFVFIGFVICLRVVSLDADMPNWNLAMYTPMDEGPYAMQAIRFARPELVKAVEALGTEGVKEWNSACCFLLTLFTTVSMKIFGNNYYGMRMGTVTASFIIVIIVLKIIWKYVDQKKRRVAVLFVGLVMAFNFSFLLASRVVEPSIFRSLLVMLVGVWVFSENGNDRNYLILGVLSTLCVIWGYVTNVFIFIPSAVLLIEELVNKKGKGAKIVGHFICGCVAALAIGEGIMYLVQGRTFIDDTIRVVFGHETKRIAMTDSMIIDNGKQILRSNMFAYNITFFVLSFLGIMYCTYTGIREKNRQKLWVGVTAIAFFLQSLFTSDFLYRKCVVIFPVLVLSIAILFAEDKLLKHRKCAVVLTAIISLLGIYGAYKRISDLDTSDMADNFKILFYCILGISLLLMVMNFIYMKKIMIAFVIAAMILPDLFMDYSYIVKANKTEKEAMVKLGEIVGENYILGYGYSYCLYNDIIPVSNAYDSYFEEEYINRNQMLVASKKVVYCLGYHGTEYINRYLEGTTFEWDEMIRFYTDFNVTPGEDEKYDLYLYECKEK